MANMLRRDFVRRLCAVPLAILGIGAASKVAQKKLNLSAVRWGFDNVGAATTQLERDCFGLFECTWCGSERVYLEWGFVNNGLALIARCADCSGLMLEPKLAELRDDTA